MIRSLSLLVSIFRGRTLAAFDRLQLLPPAPQVEKEACYRSDGSGGENSGGTLREIGILRGGLRGEDQTHQAHSQTQRVGEDLGQAKTTSREDQELTDGEL